MSKPRIKIVPIVVLLLLVAVVVSANVWRNRSQVRNIRVEIAYAGGDTLVTPQQVASLVQDKYPGMMTSRLRDVDLKTVAQAAALAVRLRGRNLYRWRCGGACRAAPSHSPCVQPRQRVLS